MGVTIQTTAFLQALPKLLERDLARVSDPSGAIDLARAEKALSKDLFDHVKQHMGAPSSSIALSYAKAVADDVEKAAGSNHILSLIEQRLLPAAIDAAADRFRRDLRDEHPQTFLPLPTKVDEESIFTDYLPRQGMRLTEGLFEAIDMRAATSRAFKRPDTAVLPKNVEGILKELSAETPVIQQGDLYIAPADGGEKLVAARIPAGATSRYTAQVLEYEYETLFERLAQSNPALVAHLGGSSLMSRFGTRGVDTLLAHDVAAVLVAGDTMKEQLVADSKAAYVAQRDATLGSYVRRRDVVDRLQQVVAAVQRGGDFSSGDVHATLANEMKVTETDSRGKDTDVTVVKGFGPLLIVHDNAGGRHNAIEVAALMRGELRFHFYYDKNTSGLLHVDAQGKTKAHEGVVALYSLGWNLQTSKDDIAAALKPVARG
jgi:hypothetical protein